MTNLYLFFLSFIPEYFNKFRICPQMPQCLSLSGFLSLFCAYLLFFFKSMEQSFLKFSQIETIIRHAHKKLCNRLLGSVRAVCGGLLQGLLEHTQEALKRAEQNPC